MAIPRDALRPSVTRKALLLLVAVGTPLAGFAIALYWRDLSVERRLRERDSLSLVDLASDTIAREITVVRSDLLLLLHEPLLGDLGRGAGPEERRRIEEKFVAFCTLKRMYDRIRVLDREGREIAAVDYHRGRPAPVGGEDLQIEGDRESLRRAGALGPDEVHVSGLDLSRRHGRIERPLKPVIRFAAPVFDRDGERTGVLVLHYLGERLLRALDDAAAGFPGSLLLLGEEGSYLRGPRPEDEWGLALGHGHRFADDHAGAWEEIAGRYRGQLLAGDGLFTFRELKLDLRPGGAIVVVAHVPRDVLRSGTDLWRWRALVTATVGAPALLAAGWYVSYSMHVRREHERRLAESESRLRRLSHELLDAQERERTALSRDLHDDLGQLVTLIALDLERARQAGEANRSASIERALDGTRRVLERLHEIAFRIRPRSLDELGLREAARSFLTEFEESTGIEVAARLSIDVAHLPRTVAENAFRILQEGLTNVSKHARTNDVEVDLRTAGDALTLRIADRGVGFDAEHPAEGLGLLGMRERVELLGGTLDVRSRPGAGTTVEARLPLHAVEEGSDER
jgi:signal transduction histidine kinase